MGSTKTYKLETLNLIMKKRVNFEEGFQYKFLKKLKNKSNLKWKELAKILEINENTLSKSYKFGLCDIPYEIFKKITKILNKTEKEVLREYKGKIKEETQIIGRKCFGEERKVFEPIKITFKNKNKKLDTSKIEFSRYDLKKKIKLPEELTPELAEEIGMQFGDGFLSAKRYDYRLKGNPKDEKKYYNDYIKPLFKKLYNLNIKIKEFENTFGFELYSKAFWEFKTKVIGIRPGKKKYKSIPNILKVNNIKILTAFIRGLFDTDGSLSFKTKYGYKKYYPEISIALYSKGLIKEVGEILQMLGFKPNVYLNEQYPKISLNGIGSLKRYEKLIGWNSQKNLNKLNDWKNRYPNLSINMAGVVQRLECTTVARETGVQLSPSAFYPHCG